MKYHRGFFFLEKVGSNEMDLERLDRATNIREKERSQSISFTFSVIQNLLGKHIMIILDYNTPIVAN